MKDCTTTVKQAMTDLIDVHEKLKAQAKPALAERVYISWLMLREVRDELEADGKGGKG